MNCLLPGGYVVDVTCTQVVPIICPPPFFKSVLTLEGLS